MLYVISFFFLPKANSPSGTKKTKREEKDPDLVLVAQLLAKDLETIFKTKKQDQKKEKKYSPRAEGKSNQNSKENKKERKNE
jgi:hypothetical protein